MALRYDLDLKTLRRPVRDYFGFFPLIFVNSEIENWVNSIPVVPNQARVNLLDGMITTIKQAGLTIGPSGTIRHLQVYAAHDQASGLFDIANPLRVGTVVGSPSWLKDRGFTHNGSSAINTGYNPFADGVALNSEAMGVFVLNNVASNTYAMGTFNSCIQPRRGTGDNVNASSQSSSGTTGSAAGATTSIGHSSINRSTSGTIRFLRNGIFYEDLSRTSASVSNHSVFSGARNSGSDTVSGGGTHQIAAQWCAISSITDAQHLAIHNALTTYLLGVGVIL